MSSHIQRGLGALAIALLLAACASDPAHYHTLVPPERDSRALPWASFLVEVLPVSIPAEADRQELVVRQEDGIAMLEGERWVVSLNDEMQAALTANLRQKLGARSVSSLALQAGKSVLRVKLDVSRFESAPGRYALIAADWRLSLAGSPGRARLLCSSHLRVPVENSYAGVVQGHRKLVEALAGQIAATAQVWMMSQDGSCQLDSEFNDKGV